MTDQSEGKFIVIEGIDGAGTTTQTILLTQALRARGRAVHKTREPSDGPIGAHIRQILRKRVVGHAGEPVDPHAMALLFAADRMDHIAAEISPRVARGEIVLSDRYDHSSVGYQSLASDGLVTMAWVRTINQHARRPDLVIVVELDAETAAKRRAPRGEDELYEVSDLQAKLADYYASLDAHFPEDTIIKIDGSRPIEAVHEELLATVLRALD